MRLKSGIFVSALVRRASLEGAFAAVRRRGAEDAGAIFVKVATLDGSCALFGPALPSLEGDSEPGVRLFAPVLPSGTPEADAEARMRKEIGFDPDLWFVEIEDRAGRHFLDLSTD